MSIQHFELDREFITLDNLLKFLAIAHSGGAAKMMVADGLVKVNGELESRKTRKLRAGDVVRVHGGEEIHIHGMPQPE